MVIVESRGGLRVDGTSTRWHLVVSALPSIHLNTVDFLVFLANESCDGFKQMWLECKTREKFNYWQISDGDELFFFLFSYTWEAFDTNNHVLYKISVCGNVDVAQCGASSAVCMHDLKTNSYRSVGK